MPTSRLQPQGVQRISETGTYVPRRCEERTIGSAPWRTRLAAVPDSEAAKWVPAAIPSEPMNSDETCDQHGQMRRGPGKVSRGARKNSHDQRGSGVRRPRAVRNRRKSGGSLLAHRHGGNGSRVFLKTPSPEETDDPCRAP